jgi:hypothetical protein
MDGMVNAIQSNGNLPALKKIAAWGVALNNKVKEENPNRNSGI